MLEYDGHFLFNMLGMIIKSNEYVLFKYSVRTAQ